MHDELDIMIREAVEGKSKEWKDGFKAGIITVKRYLNA